MTDSVSLRRVRTGIVVWVLACAGSLAAQQAEPVVFGGAVFDVTGAGTFDAGNLDGVLRPFETGPGGVVPERLEFELVIDPSGAVQGCRNAEGEALGAAGRASCDHLMAHGRFTVDPLLVLDFATATYRMTIDTRSQAEPGEPRYRVFDYEYPLQLRPVVFGEAAVPPEEQRLAREGVEIAPLTYPRFAAMAEVTGSVKVLLIFDETGAVATCRPVRSSDTARLAYDTCFAARDSVRLRQAPDPRPFLFGVTWSLS